MTLKNALCLAPMAGVTTIAMREFFALHGAGLTHTEMISCAGLVRDNAKTFDMLALSENESDVIVQLFGNDDALVREGAEVVMNRGVKFSAFGVNMACPMPKITRNGSGSALMKRPDIAAKMVKGLKSLGLPVWVKIRKFENDADTLSFVETLAEAGADNVCIHGRTPAQRYEGVADRKIVAEAAKRFPELIAASGDVKTLADIEEYLAYGCVVVMAARGALSNPFMFEEYASRFRTPAERIAELVNFAYRAREISGEHRAVVLMKRFAGSVLRFAHGSAELRNLAMQAVNLSDLLNILQHGSEICALKHEANTLTQSYILKQGVNL